MTFTILGKFGEDEASEGFYAHNPLTRNMMFFRKDSTAVGGYSLHSYMCLEKEKSKQLEADRSIFEKTTEFPNFMNQTRFLELLRKEEVLESDVRG